MENIKINEKISTYPIMEHFYTLQGEGYWSGTACYFVRLAGCKIGCFWCDVKESWDENNYEQYNPEQIISWIQQTPAHRVVITGGEPLQHDLFPLTQKLHQRGLLVHLETSGAFHFSGEFDWVCLSPKKFQLPLKENFSYANELKIIVYNAHDLIFAVEQAALCSEKTLLYLQPEWSKQQQMLPQIIDFVKQNPKWRISLQTHKFMNIP